MPYIYWPYDQINESIIKDMQILFFCTIPMEIILSHGLSEARKSWITNMITDSLDVIVAFKSAKE